MRNRSAQILLLLLLAILCSTATAKDRPWFVNASKTSGLEGVRAKECVLTDLDGDGYWDLCIDKQHLYLSDRGKTFSLHEGHGIEFPVAKRIPITRDGKADLDKVKEGPYVPQYLYFADLDNDGDQDALWGVHSHWEHFDGRNWITVKECDPGLHSMAYLNDGKGKFTRAPDSPYSGMGARGAAMSLAIMDFDHDGVLDLYEGREYRVYGVLYGCGVDRLFRGDGKGGFSDVTEAAGLLTIAEPGRANSSRPTYGVTHADINNDGRQDLLQLAYGRQWNYLWLNKGDGTFREFGMESGFSGDSITHGKYPPHVRRPPEKPFRSNGNTFDCAVGDYDNDGDLDLFVGEIQHAWAGEASDPPSILENLGEEAGFKFKRHPVKEFLPPRAFRDPRNFNYGDLHAAWLDVDNDTRLDLLIGSGDYPDGQYLRLYHQQPDGTFAEATEVAGFNWEGCGGLSIGDYDRDGDVDILAGRSFFRLSQAHRDKYMGGIKLNEVGLFRNEIGNRSGNHWLNVRLVGKKANRSGIGARITVTTGDVTQIREIRSGSGLANHQDPLEACFGLGKAKKVDRLVVRWPNGKLTEQVMKNLPADRFVEVTEGKARPKLEKAR